MTNTTFYLEHYLDSLETLPSELKKNFNKMHDLDVKNKDIMVEIDSASDEYLRKVRDLSPGKRKAEMEKIQVSQHYTQWDRENLNSKLQTIPVEWPPRE